MTFFFILALICAVWFLAALSTALPRPIFSDEAASWAESLKTLLSEERGGSLCVMALFLLTLLAGGAMLGGAQDAAGPYFGISASLFCAFGLTGAAVYNSKILQLSVR